MDSRGDSFYHPEFKFKLQFPAGWQIENQKQAVVAVSPQKNAVVRLTLSKSVSHEAAAREFFAQQGIQSEGAKSRIVHGLPSTSGRFTATSGQETVSGLAAFVEYNGAVYQLVGYCLQQQWSGIGQTIEKAVESFDKLTDAKTLALQPMRVKIIKLDRSLSTSQFIQKYSPPVSERELALINQVDVGATFRSGQVVKSVAGEKFEQ